MVFSPVTVASYVVSVAVAELAVVPVVGVVGRYSSDRVSTSGLPITVSAIGDWAILNALVNTASGATWVSFHHGGGVGMGRSLHAGQVCVADGTELAGEKIRRVLTNDPGMGVIRHVDAGYDIAERVAAQQGVRIPMREQA